MDKIGREIQANDIVLLMQGKNSRLVLCRGGLTASGLVRGINLELTNGNLNKMTFKSTNCIILERPQIISQLELQIEKVETVYNWENILGHAKRKYQDTHSIQFTEYSYRGAPISFLVEVRDPNHPTRKPRLLHPYVHKLQPVEE
jgi:hypothetical protein